MHQPLTCHYQRILLRSIPGNSSELWRIIPLIFQIVLLSKKDKFYKTSKTNYFRFIMEVLHHTKISFIVQSFQEETFLKNSDSVVESIFVCFLWVRIFYIALEQQKICETTHSLWVHLQGSVEHTFEEEFPLEISDFLLFLVPIYFAMPCFSPKLPLGMRKIIPEINSLSYFVMKFRLLFSMAP